MAELITGFIKIARAGNTADGRVIREEWLTDMAETYDPKTYTAMLWPEHMRWSGNYGEVAELKAEKDESGALCLYARLKPNYLLLWQNAGGQKLFYSLEVREDFAGSGRAYLEGLGVTDSPASLGMESTRFAARKQNPENIFIGNVALEPLARPESPEGDEAPGWFRRCFPNLFSSETKDTGMDKAMEARFTALEEQITALAKTLADHFAAPAAADGGEAPKAEAAPAASAVGEAEGTQFAALNEAIESLRKDFGTLAEEFRNTARPGTKAQETTAPSGGAGLL